MLKGREQMVELVEYIAKSLVDDPSQVRVTETSRGGTITLPNLG